MAHKQLSWRCSNQALSILILLSLPTYSFSMGYVRNWWYSSQPLPQEQQVPQEPNTSSATDTPEESQKYGFAPEMSDEQKRTYVAEGRTWQEMMEVFQDSPVGMKRIVAHLKCRRDPNWRASFLVGPPGTGKTVSMLAAPHLARWHWMFLSGPGLLGQYRNEAKEKLARELYKAILSGRKIIVLIDELNRLLENFSSASHDADATASFLWTFLDRQKNNQNFFLIGTMNRDDKLPDPVKHRFGATTVYFPAIENPVKLLTIFKNVIARSTDIELDTEECNDAFINESLNSYKAEGFDITPRDYENIRIQAAQIAGDDSETGPWRIRRAHLTEALVALTKTYNRSGIGKEQLTDDEWRDFNAIQSRIIEARMQCAHKIPVGANVGWNLFGPTFGAHIDRSPGLDMNEVIGIIEREFTRDQITLYRRVMKLKEDEPLLKRGLIDTAKKLIQTPAVHLVNAVKSVGGAKVSAAVDNIY